MDSRAVLYGKICGYCNTVPVLMQKHYDGKLTSKWQCNGCKSSVGCHPGTIKPLGSLANTDLRLYRSETHKWFDPLWKAKMDRTGASKKKCRTAGYEWLAKELGMAKEFCHIAMFDIDRCKQAILLCKQYYTK